MVLGQSGDDTLTGGTGADTVKSQGGRDDIKGNGGEDTVKAAARQRRPARGGGGRVKGSGATSEFTVAIEKLGRLKQGRG